MESEQATLEAEQSAVGRPTRAYTPPAILKQETAIYQFNLNNTPGTLVTWTDPSEPGKVKSGFTKGEARWRGREAAVPVAGQMLPVFLSWLRPAGDQSLATDDEP